MYESGCAFWDQFHEGHSMSTQPVLLWEQWKILKFQTKIQSGSDFMDFWTVRAPRHFFPRGSPCSF